MGCRCRRRPLLVAISLCSCCGCLFGLGCFLSLRLSDAASRMRKLRRPFVPHPIHRRRLILRIAPGCSVLDRDAGASAPLHSCSLLVRCRPARWPSALPAPPPDRARSAAVALDPTSAQLPTVLPHAGDLMRQGGPVAEVLSCQFCHAPFSKRARCTQRQWRSRAAARKRGRTGNEAQYLTTPCLRLYVQMRNVAASAPTPSSRRSQQLLRFRHLRFKLPPPRLCAFQSFPPTTPLLARTRPLLRRREAGAIQHKRPQPPLQHSASANPLQRMLLLHSVCSIQLLRT